MSTEESEILTFLRSWPRDYFSVKEVGRRVGGKRKYREDPKWAKPFLQVLLRKQLIEIDGVGHYRYKPEDKKKNRKHYLSPEIRGILKKSGKQFGEAVVLEDVDDLLISE